MTQTEISLLYVTAPDAAMADQIGRALVEERLAACANILPEMRSVYRWRGAVETADEAVLIVKTTKAAARLARDRILALHPYETPCIMAIPLAGDGSNPAYLDWVVGEISS